MFHAWKLGKKCRLAKFELDLKFTTARRDWIVFFHRQGLRVFTVEGTERIFTTAGTEKLVMKDVGFLVNQLTLVFFRGHRV
jgi:hypothetical protein